MSITNVVTRGYGPSAAIKFVVTRGYSLGAALAKVVAGRPGKKTRTQQFVEDARQKRKRIAPEPLRVLAERPAPIIEAPKSLPVPHVSEQSVSVAVRLAITDFMARLQASLPVPDPIDVRPILEAKAHAERIKRQRKEEDDLEVLLFAF